MSMESVIKTNAVTMGAGLVLRWNSVTMRDGRVDVLGGTENIVTIDADRHG